MKFVTIVFVIILLVISKYMIKGEPYSVFEENQFLSSPSSQPSSSFTSHKNSTDDYNDSNNSLGTIIGNCLIKYDIIKCFKRRIIERLDNAINDNQTWQINDNLLIEKNPDWILFNNNNNSSSNADTYNTNNDLDEILCRKFNDLTESRSIRLKVIRKSGVEARKKKDKGGFAVMGGIAIAAMMAQLFMGKIVMIAGVALVLSKLALIFSILNALKKGSGSSEHVVYSGGGGGGGGGGSVGVGVHENGWHRSMLRYNDEQNENNRYQEENNTL